MAIALPFKKLNRTKINLFVDIGLALAYVVELERHFTGTRNHELLGLGLAAAFLLHIVLHWRWIVSITRTFLNKLIHESRANYLLALLLVISFIVTIGTGVLISETLGLNFGIREIAGISVEGLHKAAADMSLLIVALHVAMHWKWIGTNAKKYLFSVKLPKLSARKATAALSSARQPSH